MSVRFVCRILGIVLAVAVLGLPQPGWAKPGFWASLGEHLLGVGRAGQCCVCFYSFTFSDSCTNPSVSPGDWLQSQGCGKRVVAKPIEEFSDLAKMDCDSLVIAYTGHAAEQHLDTFLKNCEDYRPKGCKNGFCALTSACGVPEDYAGLRRDERRLERMLAAFASKSGTVSVTINQTEVQPNCTSRKETHRTLLASRAPTGLAIEESFEPCAKAGSTCGAGDEVLYAGGRKRVYVSYWRCMTQLGPKVQRCCVHSDRTRTWARPGSSC